jgi:hypothetical protein
VRRRHFEHVITAAANVVQEDEFVVIGSQAILGSVDEPPAELLESMEADIYPLHRPELSDFIDGALGDGSPFDQQFGYFAHGVGPETAKAPAGWEGRLVRVDIPPRLRSDRRPVAWCLERHDLVLAKLARGFDRDWGYARVAIREGIVELDRLLELTATLPVSAERREIIISGLHAV